jgi:hypothetical protein
LKLSTNKTVLPYRAIFYNLIRSRAEMMLNIGLDGCPAPKAT